MRAWSRTRAASALQIARPSPGPAIRSRARGAVEIAGQRVDPVVADGAAEVLRRDVLELVRLVDDRALAAGITSPKALWRTAASAHSR